MDFFSCSVAVWQRALLVHRGQESADFQKGSISVGAFEVTLTSMSVCPWRCYGILLLVATGIVGYLFPERRCCSGFKPGV